MIKEKIQQLIYKLRQTDDPKNQDLIKNEIDLLQEELLVIGKYQFVRFKKNQMLRK